MPAENDYRSKPIWPIAVVILTLAALLYVVSIGPACWISSRLNVGCRVVSVVYYPVTGAIFRRPDDTLLEKLLATWTECMSDPNHYWSFLGGRWEWTYVEPLD